MQPVETHMQPVETHILRLCVHASSSKLVNSLLLYISIQFQLRDTLCVRCSPQEDKKGRGREKGSSQLRMSVCIKSLIITL